MIGLLSYVLTLTGFVPVICWAREEEYLCNDPAGFTLWQDGKPIEFDGPAQGRLPGVLVMQQRAARTIL